MTTRKEDSSTNNVNKSTSEENENTNILFSSEIKNKKNTDTPWSIRGVTSETRVYIAKAAKKEKKKLGEWINEKLLKAAQEVFTGKQFTNITTLTKVGEKEIEEKLSLMENNQKEQNSKIEQLTNLVENIARNQDKPSIFKKIFKI